MTSRTSHPLRGDSEAGPSKPKKRRTTDADWAQYQPKLKRLYINEKKSKKEVIEIMRDQDGLDITEKQLKYWFEKKWKIPKNKTRKSKITVQPTGRASTGVQYILPRNTILCNQSSSSDRRRDFLHAPLHQVCQQDNSAVDTVMSSTQEYNAPSGLDNAIVSSIETYTFAQISGTPSLSSSLDLLQPNLPTTSDGRNEGFAVHQPLDRADTATDGSQAANIPLGAFGGSFTFRESSNYPLPSFQSPPIMATPGQLMEDSFSDVFDYHGITLSPTATLKGLFSSVEVQSQDLFNPKESPGRKRRHSLSMSREGTSGIFNPSECLDAALASQSGGTSSYSRNLTPMDYLGKDLEKVIPTLQLLEERILTGLDGEKRNLSVKSFGRSLLRLQGALMSDWLQAGLDGVMHQAYQKAASRRSKQTLGITNTADTFERDDQPEYLSEENGTTSVGKVSSQLVIKSCQACSDGGTFRAELRDLLNNKDKERRRTAEMVTVSYTPRPQWHRTGVSITFSRACDDRSRIHIPPTIKTFNVVPMDAEIVLLVKKNNLNGVKELFKMGKASPTDVTPLGHSLLSYAMSEKASELFNLLLLGGADLQHCAHYSNTCDIVTTIWTTWSEIGDGMIPDNYQQSLADITNCMRLTDIALSSGCEIGSNAPYNKSIPSPLFDLCMTALYSTSRKSETTEITKYLVRKGFDREERNDVGQTPLLFAAASQSEGSIFALRALISVEADATAVDNLERGALHSVLLIKSVVCRCREASCEITEDNYSEHNYPSEEEGVLHLPEVAENNIDEVLQDEFVFDERGMIESEAGDFGEDGTIGLLQQHDFDDDKEKNEDLESLNEGISQYEEDEYENSELSEDSARLEREDLVWLEIGLEPQGYDQSLMPFGRPEAPLYPKLLLLLEAGCDPNLQDADGQTPSDYVAGTDLWPEWERALTDSGWIYDTRVKQCIRQTGQEDE